LVEEELEGEVVGADDKWMAPEVWPLVSDDLDQAD
jgi:hypothetical protein